MDSITCLGDNCVDYYDETGEAFFGGNPVNVAVYFCRLGGRASYLGAVGTDSFGSRMREAIGKKGVDVSHLQVIPGRTALTHVSVRGGERIFGDYDEGVMSDFHIREEDYAFLKNHRMAVTGLWGHCENVLAKLQELGLLTVFDCADRPYDPAARTAVPNTDILFFSDDESTEESLKEKMADLLQKGPGIVAATRGEKGSILYDGNRYYSCGIIPCRVVDTIGAGDSYIAGFLKAYLSGKPLLSCMEEGAECSAVTLQYPGAW